MNHSASLTIIEDKEDVARLLFSPIFICDGILSQKAFTLETGETYISVLRPAISSFTKDIDGIIHEGSTLYGYALLNVGEIRKVNLASTPTIKFDVLPRNAGKRKSHAGIYTSIEDKRIKGGTPASSALMLARMYLVRIAQKRVHTF